jgi:hypothetical protein
MAAPMTPYGQPSEQYHCLLDEQPYYLVPGRLWRELEESAELIVNPLCWFSWFGPLPADKATRVAFAEHFCPSDWVVWVDDPATRALWPYWVGVDYVPYLMNMYPGDVPEEEVPEPLASVLRQAQILVPPDHIERRRKEWLDQVLYGAQAFERGYVSLPDLIPAFHIGALRRYYRHHVRTGTFPFGDDQVARRYGAHNEPVARYFHHQLTNVVSDMARTLVQPSYTYFACYQGGAQLDSHTDREQCEYSITLCFDASPEPEALAPWPIELNTSEGLLRIWQHLGDSLLYRGRQLPHSRDVLPEHCTSSSLLLHYVDRDFAGSLS